MHFAPALAATKPGDKPLCARPEVRDELDAAREAKGRGAPTRRKGFVERYCVRCPVAAGCFAMAVENNEHGIWGGTTDRQRTIARGPMSYSHNIEGLHRARSPKLRIDTKDVTAAEVRAWAVSQGLKVSDRGLPSKALYAAYADTHPDAGRTSAA